jgi:hypothetical protein
VSHFVRHHEARVAEDELHEFAFFLRQKLLQLRHAVERLHRLV